MSSLSLDIGDGPLTFLLMLKRYGVGGGGGAFGFLHQHWSSV